MSTHAGPAFARAAPATFRERALSEHYGGARCPARHPAPESLGLGYRGYVYGDRNTTVLDKRESWRGHGRNVETDLTTRTASRCLAKLWRQSDASECRARFGRSDTSALALGDTSPASAPTSSRPIEAGWRSLWAAGAPARASLGYARAHLAAAGDTSKKCTPARAATRARDHLWAHRADSTSSLVASTESAEQHATKRKRNTGGEGRDEENDCRTVNRRKRLRGTPRK